MSYIRFIQKSYSPAPLKLKDISLAYAASRAVVSQDLCSLTLEELNNKWFKRGRKIYKIVYYSEYTACIFVGRNTDGVVIFVDRKPSGDYYKFPFETFSYSLWPGVGIFLNESSYSDKGSLTPIPEDLKGYVLEAWLETCSYLHISPSLFFFPS